MMAAAHSPRGVAVGELSGGSGGGVLHGDPRWSKFFQFFYAKFSTFGFFLRQKFFYKISEKFFRIYFAAKFSLNTFFTIFL